MVCCVSYHLIQFLRLKFSLYSQMLKFVNTKTPDQSQVEAIRSLWNSEYPVNIHHNSIADTLEYLSKWEDQNHTFVYDDSAIVIAWYFDFIRDNERNFAVIISNKHQSSGLGSKLITLAKETNKVLNGWVIISEGHKKSDESDYKPPQVFYNKLGFQTLEEEKEIQGLRLVKIRYTK